MDFVQIKSPATIANLSCGFDILGLCIDNPSDLIKISKINDKTVKIIITAMLAPDIPLTTQTAHLAEAGDTTSIFVSTTK